MLCVASVVVPAFNEADGLQQRIDDLAAHLARNFGDAFEIVVVDDGSTDETPAILRDAARRIAPLRVVTHAGNRGLDASIRTGVCAAKGEYIVTYDADLTYAPATIDSLVRAIEEGGEIAVASPYMHGGRCVAIPWWRLLLSRWANRYLSFALAGRLSTWTSVVRAYRGHIAHILIEDGVFTEATFGVLIAALRDGFRVVEVPAVLDWSAQPRKRASRLRPSRIAKHAFHVVYAGLRARPVLLLGVPAFAPGLLPLAVAVGVALRLPHATIALISACTAAVQYASLAAVTYTVASGGTACKRSTSKPSIFPTIKTAPGAASASKNSPPWRPCSLRGR